LSVTAQANESQVVFSVDRREKTTVVQDLRAESCLCGGVDVVQLQKTVDMLTMKLEQSLAEPKPTVADAVFFEPHQIGYATPFAGAAYNFSIPVSIVPVTATEVQVLSWVYSGNVAGAARSAFIRTATVKNGLTYPVYQKIITTQNNAIAYDNQLNWFPIGTTDAERVVFVSASGDKFTGNAAAAVLLTAYRIGKS
jgi:hypothetical protein